MLKEIIAPGVYWYPDQKTGEPRSLKVTPDHIRYWQEQGNAMLSSGLTIPVPCEHDFDALALRCFLLSSSRLDLAITTP